MVQNPAFAPEPTTMNDRGTEAGWTTPTPDSPYGNMAFQPPYNVRQMAQVSAQHQQLDIQNQPNASMVFQSKQMAAETSFTQAKYGQGGPQAIQYAPPGPQVIQHGIYNVPTIVQYEQNPQTPENVRTVSIPWLIIKRVFSVAFIILDVTFDWLQYSDMSSDVETAASVVDDTIDSVSNKKKSFSGSLDVPCETSTKITTDVYIAFSVLGTIFALVQIINLIGETVHEATRGRKGFQILHGYYEVCITYILEELPQIITTFFFVDARCTCQISKQWMVRVFGSAVSAIFSNYFRKSTCRKEPRQCCAYTWDWPYCCCYIPIIGYGDKNCTCQTVNPCDCSDCGGCLGSFGCCEPRDKDPKCAEMIADKLMQLHSTFLIVVFIKVILFNCNGWIF